MGSLHCMLLYKCLRYQGLSCTKIMPFLGSPGHFIPTRDNYLKSFQLQSSPCVDFSISPILFPFPQVLISGAFPKNILHTKLHLRIFFPEIPTWDSA